MDFREYSIYGTMGQGGVWVFSGVPKNTLNTGGAVIGAFIEGKLAGFTSVENKFLVQKSVYTIIFNSCFIWKQRKRHWQKLFQMIAQEARDLEAKKLYISAHSSEESQAFIRL